MNDKNGRVTDEYERVKGKEEREKGRFTNILVENKKKEERIRTEGERG